MSCNCIHEINAMLAQRNTCLGLTFGFPPPGSTLTEVSQRPILMTEKIVARKKGRAAIMVPTFCPFCGERYEPAPAKRAED